MLSSEFDQHGTPGHNPLHPALNSKPHDALRALLSSGPMLSRDALAALEAQGLSAKQVRTARERLGVVVERSGSGTAMRSTWRMPDESGNGKPDPVRRGGPASGRRKVTSTDERTRTRRSSVSRSGVHLRSAVQPSQVLDCPTLPPKLGPNEPLTESELARVQRRVVLFGVRGMAQVDALDLATKLVRERDRPSLPDAGGSCIECQAYVRDQCVSKPQPLSRIHYCIYMRHDAP